MGSFGPARIVERGRSEALRSLWLRFARGLRRSSHPSPFSGSLAWAGVPHHHAAGALEQTFRTRLGLGKPLAMIVGLGSVIGSESTGGPGGGMRKISIEDERYVEIQEDVFQYIEHMLNYGGRRMHRRGIFDLDDIRIALQHEIKQTPGCQYFEATTQQAQNMANVLEASRAIRRIGGNRYIIPLDMVQDINELANRLGLNHPTKVARISSLTHVVEILEIALSSFWVEKSMCVVGCDKGWEKKRNVGSLRLELVSGTRLRSGESAYVTISGEGVEPQHLRAKALRDYWASPSRAARIVDLDTDPHANPASIGSDAETFILHEGRRGEVLELVVGHEGMPIFEIQLSNRFRRDGAEGILADRNRWFERMPLFGLRDNPEDVITALNRQILEPLAVRAYQIIQEQHQGHNALDILAVERASSAIERMNPGRLDPRLMVLLENVGCVKRFKRRDATTGEKHTLRVFSLRRPYEFIRGYEEEWIRPIAHAFGESLRENAADYDLEAAKEHVSNQLNEDMYELRAVVDENDNLVSVAYAHLREIDENQHAVQLTLSATLPGFKGAHLVRRLNRDILKGLFAEMEENDIRMLPLGVRSFNPRVVRKIANSFENGWPLPTKKNPEPSIDPRLHAALTALFAATAQGVEIDSDTFVMRRVLHPNLRVAPGQEERTDDELFDVFVTDVLGVDFAEGDLLSGGGFLTRWSLRTEALKYSWAWVKGLPRWFVNLPGIRRVSTLFGIVTAKRMDDYYS